MGDLLIVAIRLHLGLDTPDTTLVHLLLRSRCWSAVSCIDSFSISMYSSIFGHRKVDVNSDDIPARNRVATKD